MALLILRLLEKKLECQFTTSQIIDALREYKVLDAKGYGYLPEYTRTDITDKLHEVFIFRTDTEIVPPGVILIISLSELIVSRNFAHFFEPIN